MTQQMKSIINFTLTLLLILGCLLVLPAPGIAHVATDHYSWSAPFPVEEEPEAEEPLLTATGRHVMLDYLDGIRSVEVPVPVSQNVYWSVSAETDTPEVLSVSTSVLSEDWINASVEGLEETWFYSGDDGNILLTLQNLRVAVVEEETPVTDTALVDVKVTMITIPETAEGTTEEPMAVVVGELSAQFHVPLTPDVGVSPAGTLVEYPAHYHPDAALVLVNGSTNTALSLLAGEFPANTCYEVNGEEYILYDAGPIMMPADATIVLHLPQEEESDAEATEPVLSENETVIPELGMDELLTEPETKTEDEEQMESEITVETEDPVEEVEIPTLTLVVGGYEYSFVYEEVPVLDTEGRPLIMRGGPMVLPIAYRWRDLTPVITVERMVCADGGITWVSMDAASWQAVEAGTGTLLSAPAEAKPGTYRLTATWRKEAISLYQVETVIYIQNRFTGQDGG